MLLFKKPFFAGLVSGTITLTFRRWQKPHVRVGGRYRCHPIGVLEVDDVRTVTVGSISGADATLAGFPSRDALVAYLAELGPLDASTLVFRVSLHHGGDGDRVPLALEESLSAEDVKTIDAKLAKMDGTEPWTRQTLALIGKHPRVAASKLLKGPGKKYKGSKKALIEAIHDALYCSKICSYAQGFQLMRTAQKEYKWKLNFGEIAQIWRGGCIIRAAAQEARPHPEFRGWLRDSAAGARVPRRNAPSATQEVVAHPSSRLLSSVRVTHWP